MAATSSNYSDVLKIVYERTIAMQFTINMILLRLLKKKVEKRVQGQKLQYFNDIGVSGGVGWSRNNTLPADGAALQELAEFNWETMRGAIGVEGDIMDDSASNDAAFVNVMEREQNSLIKELSHFAGVTLAGDGTGQVATIESVTNSTTFVVADARLLVSGMRVDIIRISDGGVGGGAAGVRIKVNKHNRTCTIIEDRSLGDSTTVSAALTSYALYMPGARNAVPVGLAGIVDDANPPSGVGNYGAIDRSDNANAFWQAWRYHNDGNARPIHPGLIADALTDIKTEMGDEEPGNRILLAHPKQCNELKKWLQANTSYFGGETTIATWYKTIMFQGDIPIVESSFIAPDRMYLLNLEDFRFIQDREGHWQSNDPNGGGGIWRWVEQRDAYKAYWKHNWLLGCLAPRNNAVIEDLEYDTPMAA